MTGSLRLLLVEDDPETTRFVRKGLEEAGHVVDHAGDGKEGLLLALDASHDVVVVDRMLPGLDGLSIVRSLRAADRTAPVLVLSALGEVDDRVEGLRAGGDDYLVKPFAFIELSHLEDADAREGARRYGWGGHLRRGSVLQRPACPALRLPREPW